MRHNYPVYSKEVLKDFREIQEHLIYLLGYDKEVYDGYIDVSGIYDQLDEGISASGVAFFQDRVGEDKRDGSLYSLANQAVYLNAVNKLRDGV